MPGTFVRSGLVKLALALQLVGHLEMQRARWRSAIWISGLSRCRISAINLVSRGLSTRPPQARISAGVCGGATRRAGMLRSVCAAPGKGGAAFWLLCATKRMDFPRATTEGSLQLQRAGGTVGGREGGNLGVAVPQRRRLAATAPPNPSAAKDRQPSSLVTRVAFGDFQNLAF
jgi:hypothetical protein